MSLPGSGTGDPQIASFVQAHGLADDPAEVVMTPLAGGVASDIFRIEVGSRCFAVKRALPRLRVEQDWQVPTTRNAHEVAWLQLAGSVVPGSVPRVLAHDPQAGLFAMSFLDPATHPVWKTELAAGRADPAFAAAVGRTLAAIHGATAHRPALAERFANQPLFQAIRLDPYFGTAARANPDLAASLGAVSHSLSAARVALMHGDVSPKNILCSPAGARWTGPVLLDAECACYGDPAFDAAFCLCHLLLKCVWRPEAATRLMACFDALAAAWLEAANWEQRDGLQQRVARLLPALLLARIDGKSPVEYITQPEHKAAVRGFARAAMLGDMQGLQLLRDDWAMIWLRGPGRSD